MKKKYITLDAGPLSARVHLTSIGFTVTARSMSQIAGNVSFALTAVCDAPGHSPSFGSALGIATAIQGPTPLPPSRLSCK